MTRQDVERSILRYCGIYASDIAANVAYALDMDAAYLRAVGRRAELAADFLDKSQEATVQTKKRKPRKGC